MLSPETLANPNNSEPPLSSSRLLQRRLKEGAVLYSSDTLHHMKDMIRGYVFKKS